MLVRTAKRLVARHGKLITFTFRGAPTRDPLTRDVTFPSSADVECKAYFSRIGRHDAFAGYEAEVDDRIVLVAADVLGQALVRGTLITDGDVSARVEHVDHVTAHGEVRMYRGVARGV